AQRIGLGAAWQGAKAVDGLADSIDGAAQPGHGGIDRTVMALEHGPAAQPHPAQLAKGQAQRVPIAKADDLGGKRAAIAALDHDATTYAQLAHGTDHFHQEPLDGFDASKHLDIVYGIDCRYQRLHGRPPSQVLIYMVSAQGRIG